MRGLPEWLPWSPPMQSMEILIVIVGMNRGLREARGGVPRVRQQAESTKWKMTLREPERRPAAGIMRNKKRRHAFDIRCTAFIEQNSKTAITRRSWS
jgi:hypothetical protein